MMSARFEGYVHGGAASALAGCAKGEHLGVRVACPPMPAFADYDTVSGNHAADAGIRGRTEEAAGTELQCAGHEIMIGGGERELHVP
jgi:hypothetical protein